MIVDTPKEDYIEKFEKKFRGFCERAPVYITFSIAYNKVFVEDVSSKKSHTFELDESIPVEDFIKKIKIFLKENSYPRLIGEKIVNKEPSIEDLMSYTRDKGATFDEAYSKLSKAIETSEFLIDKINIKKNQLVIEDREGKQYLYQLSMPVVLFLRNFANKDPKEAFTKLKEDGSFLYQIERKK